MITITNKSEYEYNVTDKDNIIDVKLEDTKLIYDGLEFSDIN